MEKGIRSADRIEAFLAAVDLYEPTLLGEHADAFRVFARFISHTIDGRYLDRHPIEELLPHLEQLMAASVRAAPANIMVKLDIHPSGKTGVLMTCMPDCNFIFSLVRLTLEELGIRYFRSTNSVIPIRRTSSGDIDIVGLQDSQKESFIWMEVEHDQLAERADEIKNLLHERLGVLNVVVSDYSEIRLHVERLARRFAELANQRPDHRQLLEDNARFLRWMLNDHFVFMGTEHIITTAHKSLVIPGLGKGKFRGVNGIQIYKADQAVLELEGISPFLWIRKTAAMSWMYRAGQCDHVLVQNFDEEGKPAGIVVLDGLFSFQALAESRTDTPLLDRVVSELYARLKATKGSHRYRLIRNAFNSLPLEYLFSLQVEDIVRLVEQVMEVDAQQRIQIHMTVDADQHTVLVFVALPRSHYSDELRADIRKLVKHRFKAKDIDDGVYAGNAGSVTFHYFLTGISDLSVTDQEILQRDIEQSAIPWGDRLLLALQEQYPRDQARERHNLYSEAFSPQYRETTSVHRAVSDINILEEIDDDAGFDCDVYQEKDDKRPGITRLRMFGKRKLYLSDMLPILDNLGLIVIDQFPTSIHIPGHAEYNIATFRIGGVQNMKIDLNSRRNRLKEGIRAVVIGAMSNEPLNRLLLRADIPWTYTALMRAYQHYARQLGLPFAQAVVDEALLSHGNIVHALTEFFRAKFDPELADGDGQTVSPQRLEWMDRSRGSLNTLLEGIEDLTSDQILRTIFNLVDATIRTNFYARSPLETYHIVLKFDPSKITRMPDPRPFREIYVHHPKMAGLHLRCGPVARGGLRWSDRKLDFRTEVLGLMATQDLKNVMIVPRGAKGGFVLLSPPSDPAESRAAGDEAYKIFVRALLDVTDNLVDGKPVGHDRVICHEGPDPYLVVAADKGTAHQSDNANKIAVDRGFWLDDAFASGSSTGYDHKVEGITAKGGWECVKRHFREMGVDPEKEKIRVVGIGDMSGDVFGNGLLRSKTMLMIAAFDHRHIFIDPEPDPDISYAARATLFKVPRSSWMDYPKEALGQGAGIYPRGAKAIALSPQARKALGIVSDASLSGPELVKLILAAPVDLLWNGGIGTYIRASTETNNDVGDPGTDLVRVVATDVRAKVIGEGGNLGITQLGRIELAQRGVRLNTDALDNSAGVDLSDHEVNLKILFKVAENTGKLTRDARNLLLEEIRETVDAMTLNNNWVQSRMVSLDQIRSQRDLPRFSRALDVLEERVPFRRKLLQLPSTSALKQRAEHGFGLVRPEISVLCANAKMDLKQQLVASKVFPPERIQDDLIAYFPKQVVEQFRHEILTHPLAEDIALTMLTNRIIADCGAAWIAETTAMTGRTTPDVLEAYFKATDLLGAKSIKQHIDEVQLQLSAEAEYALRLQVEDAIAQVAEWTLMNGSGVNSKCERAIQLGLEHPETWMKTNQEHDVERKIETWMTQFLDRSMAQRLAAYGDIQELLDAAWLSSELDIALELCTSVLTNVGQHTGLQAYLHETVRGTVSDLDRPAQISLKRRLRRYLLEMASYELSHQEAGAWKPSKSLDVLRAEMLATLGHAADHDLACMVVVADRVERHVRRLRHAV